MKLAFNSTGTVIDAPDSQADSLIRGGFSPLGGAKHAAKRRERTRAELAEEAASLGIEVDGKATKAELETLINEARA